MIHFTIDFAVIDEALKEFGDISAHESVFSLSFCLCIGK